MTCKTSSCLIVEDPLKVTKRFGMQKSLISATCDIHLWKDTFLSRVVVNCRQQH